MNVKVIDAAGVRARFSVSECIEAMAQAMIGASAASHPMVSRIVMPLVDGSGYLGIMAGSIADPPVYGAKIVSLHPSNAACGRPTIQGFVALFNHDTGEPMALVDGAEITALRTGAVSALATRLLARSDARSLGLIGYGVQARSHLEAICAVRDVEEVRVWGRSHGKAVAFAERHSYRSGPKIVAVTSPDIAAACDIVCTVTAAREPVIRGDWLRRGAHVNLVGAHTATTRESDTALITRGRLYVDSRTSAFSESGDILIPIGEGAIDRSHVIGEIGNVLLGQVAGRTSEDEVTIYKSLGLVAQDLFAAYSVYQAHSTN